jgi:hypothetical protein
VNLEVIPWQSSNFTGIGEHSNGALSDRDSLCGGIAFAASFEKVLETRIRVKCWNSVPMNIFIRLVQPISLDFYCRIVAMPNLIARN